MKYLIAGLGNIGAEYANTRHNIGFTVLDALARDAGISFSTDRYAAKASLRHKGKTLILVKPSTYMNLSGKAVRYWLEKENIPLENLLVIVDDIALPLGQLRMKTKGGDGGHNGLTSIIEILGTEEFTRLRFGIGGDFPKGYQVDYVLGEWTADEEKIFVPRIPAAFDIIKSFVTIGPEKTMTNYNNRF
jgi:peptidyl-tRNA hydrolase, PTH1 family